MEYAEKYEDITERSRAEEKLGKHDYYPSHPLHVLVVDDERMIRDIVTLYLSVDGHTVETATNGREGLEKFCAGEFDVVITDRSMPYMSGDKLAPAIKQVAPNKPIIMLTGFGNIMKASGEMPAGVDLVMSKPVTLDDFQSALKKVVFRSES